MTLRSFRLALALVAATAHLVVPAVAYAKRATPMLAGDLCSTVRSVSARTVGGGIPSPASHEHHCAHAPCCVSGAGDTAAPFPSLVRFAFIASAAGAKPAAETIAAPVVPIVAAQPRGPPVPA